MIMIVVLFDCFSPQGGWVDGPLAWIGSRAASSNNCELWGGFQVFKEIDENCPTVEQISYLGPLNERFQH